MLGVRQKQAPEVGVCRRQRIILGLFGDRRARNGCDGRRFRCCRAFFFLEQKRTRRDQYACRDDGGRDPDAPGRLHALPSASGRTARGARQRLLRSVCFRLRGCGFLLFGFGFSGSLRCFFPRFRRSRLRGGFLFGTRLRDRRRLGSRDAALRRSVLLHGFGLFFFVPHADRQRPMLFTH